MAIGFAEASKVPDEIDSGIPNGTQYQIACKSWFTSTGELRPLSFKFEGDDGTMIYVSNLNILYSEDKNYSGIPSKEFSCQAVVAGLLRNFKLIFYTSTYRWIMIV